MHGSALSKQAGCPLGVSGQHYVGLENESKCFAALLVACFRSCIGVNADQHHCRWCAVQRTAHTERNVMLRLLNMRADCRRLMVWPSHRLINQREALAEACSAAGQQGSERCRSRSPRRRLYQKFAQPHASSRGCCSLQVVRTSMSAFR